VKAKEGSEFEKKLGRFSFHGYRLMESIFLIISLMCLTASTTVAQKKKNSCHTITSARLSRDTEIIWQIQCIPRKLGYMSLLIKIAPCLNEVNSQQTQKN